MWAVSAIRNNRQVPTFYMNENVQGIISSEHAARIAAEILNMPIGDEGITVVWLGAVHD